MIHGQKPITVKIHTAPYTNFTVALFVMSILITWFGEKVAWQGVLPKYMITANRVFVAIQSTTVIVKLFSHINCLADLENGLWYNPNKGSGVTVTKVKMEFISMKILV